MRVLDNIIQTLRQRKMHMTLIDPANQSTQKAGKIAEIAGRVGTDAFMVGGSTGVNRDNLEETIREIRQNAPGKPIIHFPTAARVLSPSVDAIYFMSYLNSKNVNNVIGEQVAGAVLIKKLGIEPIAMGYLVFEPGMKVGEVGEAMLIKRDDAKTAVSYAIAAEFLGMRLIYLEAGSGADKPVSTSVVKAIRKEVTIPIIVGGGIRDGKTARSLVSSGADVLVTGTLVEEDNFEDRLKEILSGML
ncbi:MAG: geranylgeranylglyceryl/heptaprenylglyceryl phosphate synthase [Thermoplasmata archaeon]|nr:geranylgeranylglyceryl/heptaprenylglyceryl phosphate synthase [Thermoplasmata archaeon]